VRGRAGQNGSGKSTLVRTLSTLLLPDGGSARVFGHDVVRDAGAVRRLVNRVSVEASFFKRMSALENLSYAARFLRADAFGHAPAHPRDPREGGLPRQPRLGPMEDLSRGMPAEGRARAGAPHVAGAAAPRRADDGPSIRAPSARSRGFIRELRAEHDTTILLCTHDLAEAEALAERVGILHSGRLPRARAGGAAAPALRRRDARGRVLRRDRSRDRGRGGGRGRVIKTAPEDSAASSSGSAAWSSATPT